MSKKVTFKTLENVLKEIDRAALNQHRVTSDIENDDVRVIIERGTQSAITCGIPKLGVAAIGAGLGAAGVGLGAAGGAAAAGGTIMAITGGGVAAAEGAAVGAAAGAPIPIVGPIIGAVVGLGVGVAVGMGVKQRSKNKMDNLYQDVIKKQNGIIEALIKELERLKAQLNRSKEDNARLQYLLGCLAAYAEIYCFAVG